MRFWNSLFYLVMEIDINGDKLWLVIVGRVDSMPRLLYRGGLLTLQSVSQLAN